MLTTPLGEKDVRSAPCTHDRRQADAIQTRETTAKTLPSNMTENTCSQLSLCLAFDPGPCISALRIVGGASAFVDHADPNTRLAWHCRRRQVEVKRRRRWEGRKGNGVHPTHLPGRLAALVAFDGETRVHCDGLDRKSHDLDLIVFEAASTAIHTY